MFSKFGEKLGGEGLYIKKDVSREKPALNWIGRYGNIS